MISDCHVHTTWSSDSGTPVETQIQRAIDLGMKQLCITDHQDYDAPRFAPDYFSFLIDNVGDDDAIGRYLADLNSYKERYADKIELLFGIELGMQPHLGDKLEQLAQKFPFDFIIGSTHSFEGKDAEDRSHYEGVSIETAVGRYFEEELRNIQSFRHFDVAGHMDFVLRYGPGAQESFTYAKYGDILDEILKTLIETGRGIECNTSKFKAKNMTNPDRSILKRYAELGGEILTFGSDAHTPDRIGEGFGEVGEMVKACGLRHYCVFRNHQPTFYEIP